MAMLFAEYKVMDPARFRTVFTEFADVRRESGATGHRLLSSPDDPSIMAVAIEFDSTAAARQFCDDPRRLEALEQAGVIERADQVLEDVEAVRY